MLKTSLLHCIASVRIIGGEVSAMPLEKKLAAFEKDAIAWEKLYHSKVFDRAEAVFKRLSAQTEDA